MSHQLYCGAARRCITPGPDFFPYEGPVGRIVNGVSDRLYVRAIAVQAGEDKMLIIGYDLIGAPLPDKAIPLISAATGIPEDRILYTASHAHATVTPKLSENSPQKLLDYVDVVLSAVVEAAKEAVAAMRPAKFGYGTGSSYINVNRNQVYHVRNERNEIVDQYCLLGQRWDGPSDKTVAIARFDDMDGKPIAFFVNYAVHCNAMYGNELCGDMGVSGDIGGLTSQHIEAKFDGCVAVWTAGAAGDQGAIVMNHVYYPAPDTGDYYETCVRGGDYENIQALAARHFDDILLANDNIVCGTAEVKIASAVGMAETPARDVTVVSPDNPDGLTCRDVKILWADYQRGNYMPPVVYSDSDEPYQVRLQLITLGDVAFLGASGELYSSLGTHLKEISPYKNTIIVTHASSFSVGSKYIYDDEGCTIGGNGGLGYYGSRMKPGYIKTALEETMLDLFDQIDTH